MNQNMMNVINRIIGGNAFMTIYCILSSIWNDKELDLSPKH